MLTPSEGASHEIIDAVGLSQNRLTLMVAGTSLNAYAQPNEPIFSLAKKKAPAAVRLFLHPYMERIYTSCGFSL